MYQKGNIVFFIANFYHYIAIMLQGFSFTTLVVLTCRRISFR